MESGEQVSKVLSDYFSGSLLQFRYDILDIATNKSVKTKMQDIVMMDGSFQPINNTIYSENAYNTPIDPFPRSSVFIKDYYNMNHTVYFLDRQLYLSKYDVLGTSLGHIDLMNR